MRESYWLVCKCGTAESVGRSKGKCEGCGREYDIEPEDCPTCREIREVHKGFGPSHRGSTNCKSGSIASGGQNAHCSCDTCF